MVLFTARSSVVFLALLLVSLRSGTALTPPSRVEQLPLTASITAASASSSSSRRNFFVQSAAAVAGWGLIQQPAAHAESPQQLNVPLTGAKAPPFELPNSRGEGETTLDQLVQAKKWTVLYFYPGAFSQGCTLEAKSFQRDMEKYRALNAQIVGVSVDPPEKNAQFCSAEGLDFYMLSDRGGAVSRLYGTALSVPGFGTFSNRQTYVIDPDGKLRWVFTDVESRIPRHSSEVLEKLSELTGTTLAVV